MVEVLYSDNHVLVVNKIAGIATQSSGILCENVEDRARDFVKHTRNKKEAVFLHAVHRLDKAVSGVVLFACTSKALCRLHEEIKKKKFHKIYRTVVQGKPMPSEGTLNHYLIHDFFHTVTATSKNPAAKLASLSYRTLNTNGTYSLLEIVLETGRYHQIRAQMAAIGHPIVNDTKYGASAYETVCDSTIALHHYELSFRHPTLKTMCIVQASFPKTQLWQIF